MGDKIDIFKIISENFIKPILNNKRLVLLIIGTITGWGLVVNDWINKEHVVEPTVELSAVIPLPPVVCGCDAAIKRHEKGDKH